MDKTKINFSHNLLGCRFDNWLRLKKENPITNKKQARFITAVTFAMGIPAFLEWAIFHRAIARTQIRKDPVYIVGYWRSGTTFLQNLLTRDPQFAWFDPVKTVTFNNCILMKHVMAFAQKRLLRGARPMDNLEYTLDLPMEGGFPQATVSPPAISHMLVFPDGGNGVKYIETAFIDEQNEKKQREWRKAYDYILRKVTYLSHGKQLLLKSPENTCRIGELKRCYPGAKFINIFRNPYKVVMSTINMFTKEMGLFCLNEPAPYEVIEEVTISLFERIYRKAIRELEEMPQEDRIDICYEEFCKDPLRYVETIYRHLGLGGFEEARPYFEKYLDSQKDYQKNQFTLNPKLRDKINSRLGFYFDYYGYEMITE